MLLKAFTLVLLFISFANAEEKEIWISSNTATQQSLIAVCRKSAILHGVCLNTTGANATMTIYNSSFTATNVFSTGVISGTGTIKCNYYDIFLPNGLSYVTAGTANWTILYRCISHILIDGVFSEPV